MTEAIYSVSGMACGYCANFLTETVKRIPGVANVSVDLENETVTLTSNREIDLADVRTAVENAGYELTGPASTDPIRN